MLSFAVSEMSRGCNSFCLRRGIICRLIFFSHITFLLHATIVIDRPIIHLHIIPAYVNVVRSICIWDLDLIVHWCAADIRII